MGRPATDYTAQRFGSLTAIRMVGMRRYGNNKGGTTFWLMRCDCGAEIERAVDHIKKNRHNACPGCRSGARSHAWQGHGELPQDVFNTIRHSAASKDLPFEITIEYLWDLFLQQERRCALTGELLFFNKTFAEKKTKTASLDRIDSTRGYVEGNLQWVHRDVNKLKKNLPNERFLSLCLAVADHINRGRCTHPR